MTRISDQIHRSQSAYNIGAFGTPTSTERETVASPYTRAQKPKQESIDYGFTFQFRNGVPNRRQMQNAVDDILANRNYRGKMDAATRERIRADLYRRLPIEVAKEALHVNAFGVDAFMAIHIAVRAVAPDNSTAALPSKPVAHHLFRNTPTDSSVLGNLVMNFNSGRIRNAKGDIRLIALSDAEAELISRRAREVASRKESGCVIA